jgi:hypothetical protein
MQSLATSASTFLSALTCSTYDGKHTEWIKKIESNVKVLEVSTAASQPQLQFHLSAFCQNIKVCRRDCNYNLEPWRKQQTFSVNENLKNQPVLGWAFRTFSTFSWHIYYLISSRDKVLPVKSCGIRCQTISP